MDETPSSNELPRCKPKYSAFKTPDAKPCDSMPSINTDCLSFEPPLRKLIDSNDTLNSYLQFIHKQLLATSTKDEEEYRVGGHRVARMRKGRKAVKAHGWYLKILLSQWNSMQGDGNDEMSYFEYIYEKQVQPFQWWEKAMGSLLHHIVKCLISYADCLHKPMKLRGSTGIKRKLIEISFNNMNGGEGCFNKTDSFEYMMRHWDVLDETLQHLLSRSIKQNGHPFDASLYHPLQCKNSNLLLQEYRMLYLKTARLRKPTYGDAAATFTSLRHLRYKQNCLIATNLIRRVHHSLRSPSEAQNVKYMLRQFKKKIVLSDEKSFWLVKQFFALICKKSPILYKRICYTLRSAATTNSSKDLYTELQSVYKLLDPLRGVQKCFLEILRICEDEQRMRETAWADAKRIYRLVIRSKPKGDEEESISVQELLKEAPWWTEIGRFPMKAAVIHRLHRYCVTTCSVHVFTTLIDRLNKWYRGELTFSELSILLEELLSEEVSEIKLKLHKILKFEDYKAMYLTNSGNLTLMSPPPIHVTSYHPYLSLAAQNYKKWEKYGDSSYRKLPPDMPCMISSGRESWHEKVLNDEWVLIPENSESHAKFMNVHEEALFKLEDERYIVDIEIGRLRSLLKAFTVMLKRLMESEYINSPTIDTHYRLSSRIHKQILKKMFGKHSEEIEEQIDAHPQQFLPALISRLEKKLIALEKRRNYFDINIWRNNEEPHWASLNFYGGGSNFCDVNRRYNTRSSKHTTHTFDITN